MKTILKRRRFIIAAVIVIIIVTLIIINWESFTQGFLRGMDAA